jgi:hypothetical protein
MEIHWKRKNNCTDLMMAQTKKNTLQVLDLIKKSMMRKAAFCIGIKNTEKHSEIVQRTIAEGHIVGNHSFIAIHIFFDFFRKKKLIEELEKQMRSCKFTEIKSIYSGPPMVLQPSIRRAFVKSQIIK